MVAFVFIALLQSQPATTRNPSPAASATFAPDRPAHAGGPIGAPLEMSRPAIFSVSPRTVTVRVAGPPPEPTPGSTAFIGPGEITAIDVAVYDPAGAVVARGLPLPRPAGGLPWFRTDAIDLDAVLAPASDAYTVTARYHNDPAHEVSVKYLIPSVPAIVTRVGTPYILTRGVGAPISTILYVRSIERDGDETHVTMRTRGSHSIEERFDFPRDRGIVGPMVVSPDLTGVRRRYLNTDAVIHDAALTCYNARGQSLPVALMPGKHVHIDLIARAADSLTPVPNDPKDRLRCLGVCDYSEDTFVQSPLIVGFHVESSDVRAIVLSAVPHFDEPCNRGYIVLRDLTQLRDITTVVR